MHSKLHIIGVAALFLIITVGVCLYTFNTTVEETNTLNQASQSQISQDITQRLEAERRWTQETLKFELAAIQIEQKITNSLLHRILRVSSPGIIEAEEVRAESSTNIIDSHNTRNSNNVIYYPRAKSE